MFKVFMGKEIMEGHKKEVRDLTDKIIRLEAENNSLKSKIDSQDYTIEGQRVEIKTLKFDLNHQEQKNQLELAKALQAQAEKTKEALVKSDLEREKALSAIRVYEKMDTKADANTIKEMFGKIIEVIGKKQTEINMVK